MKKFTLILFMWVVLPASAQTVKITPGSDYDGYSNAELRRRVHDLERAVSKLQDQMVQVALKAGSTNSNSGGGSGSWTCQITAFGKTYVAGGNTRSSALAQVLKKCGDDSNAIHCSEKDAKCGDD